MLKPFSRPNREKGIKNIPYLSYFLTFMFTVTFFLLLGGFSAHGTAMPTGSGDIEKGTLSDGYATVAGSGLRELGVLPDGTCYSAVVSNGRLYMANGRGLEIYDVSNPAAPVKLGKHILKAFVYKLCVSGNYVYAAVFGSGLEIVNIANPAAPVTMSVLDLNGSATSVAVAGNVVCVGVRDQGMAVVDVSNLSAPVQTGFLSTPIRIWDVRISGTYAYITDLNEGLRIADIGNISAPVEVGFCATPGVAYEVDLYGNYAYVADGTYNSEGVKVIDVSVPSAPVQVKKLSGSALGLHISGSTLYVTSQYSGLNAYDLSTTPGAPVSLASKSDPDYADKVFADGNWLYTIDNLTDLQIVEFSGTTFTERACLSTPGRVVSACVSGIYAYLAYSSGLRVVNVANPANPVVVGTLAGNWNAKDILVSGSYVYVAELGHIRIIDVSNPASPVQATYFDAITSIEEMSMQGNYIYLANLNAGFKIVDISNPLSPQLVSTLATPAYAWDVHAFGDYAYIGMGPSGIYMVDISNPATPAHVTTIDVFPNKNVFVAGSYAYVSQYNSMAILDISTPASPAIVSTHSTPTLRMHVSGAYAISFGGEGVNVFNVSNPLSPYIIDTLDNVKSNFDIDVKGGKAYVADGEAGMAILDVSDYTPSLTVTAPNGGELWEEGTEHEITWNSFGIGSLVKIEYSVDGGDNWTEVVASTDNDGSYMWTMPQETAENVRIRVSDTAGSIWDISDTPFAIVATPSLSVTSPNGGEIIEGNTNYPVTWTFTGIIDNVNIEYSSDNGGAWSLMAENVTNSGSYDWLVPTGLTIQGLIKVSDAAGSSVDQSDAVFEIVPERTITVTAPNGGEGWEANSEQVITWTHTGTIDNVKIDYSTDGGNNWVEIVASTVNNGSFNWNVPVVVSAECKIRISDLSLLVADESDAVFSILEQRTISVTAPNGGESWEAGTNQAVTWTSTGSIANVKLEYSTDGGGNWVEIAASAPNNGTFDWAAPTTVSTNCKVKISDVDGPAVDESDAVFSILEQRTISVTAPNGGESWEAGTNQAVTWTSTGSIGNVKVEYTTDGGGNWVLITPSTANNGNLNWTVPATVSTDCKVKISDVDGPAVDESNGVFSILAQRTISVSAPNGGESWEAGTNQAITWTSTGSIANVKVEYSTDGGGNWVLITPSTANNGNLNWTVPATVSTDCKVKISDVDGPAVDESNGVFSILAQRTISVSAPNGGESWEAGTNQAITWTSTGSIANVKVEYSTDGGGNWVLITPSTANNGNLNWTVPATVSTDCKVKISDVDGPAVDESNGVFSILAQRTISVSAPNGGESCEAGTNQAITWTSTGNIANVKVEYSTDGGGNWVLITPSTANNGNLNWTVPATVSTDCKVKISDVDGPAVDESNGVFSILAQRTISVSAPNGGESWEAGTNQAITWTSTGSIANVKVEYTTDGGGNWVLITPSTANNGNLNWTVPATVSTDCKVKISDVDGPAVDESNGVFSILAQRTISVSAPNGGESWEAGTNQAITWTSTGSIANVKVEYTTDSGGNWVLITPSTANIGNLNWTVPATVSTDCKVKISDVDGPAVDESNGVFSILAQRTISVSAPNGGESWEAGTNQAITWTSTGNIANVKVEYTTDGGGNWVLITPSTANNGNLNWTVPATVSTDCKVKISDVDGPAVDESNGVFSILAQRTISVSAPNGGESWEAGTNQAITWTSTGSIANVKVEYTTDGGGNWVLITPSTANNGNLNWTVPATVSTDCKVKISDVDGPAVDESNGVFSILAQRTISVSAPNGGESWEAGTNQAITWTSTGNIANVKVEYTTDGGTNWNLVTASTANNGNYNWPVPNTPSSNCKVKISDVAGPAVDQSSGVFTILPQPAITVTSPNGGESWRRRSDQQITWFSVGNVGNVKIEYSTNGGTSWTTITSSTTNNGSYTWRVPRVSSTISTCLVRISETDGTPSDTSDAYFTIRK